MRVLYFTRDYTPHDHRFLTSLVASEHEIFSLRLERSARQVEERALPEKVRQVQWLGGHGQAGWADYPALCLDFQRVLREVQPDLVHAGPVPTVAFLAALSGFHPLVCMSWGSDLLRDVDRDGRQFQTARFALRHSEVLVADCHAVQEKAVAMGFPAQRVTLFPWGVDLKRFSPGAGDELRNKRGWQDAFVLLSLRSWEEVYGVDMLARAFVKAAQAEPALRLVLLSDGSQAESIRKILRCGGVEERVFYGGQVSNDRLPEIYRAADLYLSASRCDGSSVSLMEALACGLPALVSDIPGNREWLSHSAAGWLFKDGDEDDLAHYMVRIAHDRPGLIQARAAARQLAEQRADWRMNFPKLLAAYQQAVPLHHSQTHEAQRKDHAVQ